MLWRLNGLNCANRSTDTYREKLSVCFMPIAAEKLVH
jgi:hypothetical protein